MLLDDLSSRQGLFVQREFFDDALRQLILSESKRSPVAAGAIFRDAATMVDEDYRRCGVVEMSPALEQEVASRFDGVAAMLEAHFHVGLEGFQRPRLLRYQSGDFFVAHQDSDGEGPQWLRDRKITAVVFVNGQDGNRGRGDYRGGTLTLYRLSEDALGDDVRTRVQGEPGLLVAFRASLFHEVSRITRGERLSIVTWFY
jgi:SM-20-related protein